MNLTYLSVTLTMLALTVALYLWQEPKIEPIEEKRLNKLREKADSLANRTEEEVFDYLVVADEKDRNILMSVKAFSPYNSIKWALGISLFLSLAFGLASRFYSGNSFSVFGLEISINDMASIVLVPIWFFIGYQLWGEFKYMKDIIERFK